jgi:hypothetical protein
MSGTSGERVVLVTPSARTLPDLTAGSTAGMTDMTIWTSPEMVSIIAGVTPLYGT